MAATRMLCQTGVPLPHTQFLAVISFKIVGLATLLAFSIMPVLALANILVWAYGVSSATRPFLQAKPNLIPRRFSAMKTEATSDGNTSLEL